MIVKSQTNKDYMYFSKMDEYEPFIEEECKQCNYQIDWVEVFADRETYETAFNFAKELTDDDD